MLSFALSFPSVPLLSTLPPCGTCYFAPNICSSRPSWLDRQRATPFLKERDTTAPMGLVRREAKVASPLVAATPVQDLRFRAIDLLADANRSPLTNTSPKPQTPGGRAAQKTLRSRGKPDTTGWWE